MTRCYEFYCMVLKNPEFCEGKGDRIVDYINEYVTFMQQKGIAFDKSQTDKARFYSMQQKYGSEKAVTQGKTQQVAELLSPILEAPPKTSVELPSLAEKSVKTCPDGVCTLTPQEFEQKIGVQYPFETCLCKSCENQSKCYGGEEK